MNNDKRNRIMDRIYSKEDIVNEKLLEGLDYAELLVEIIDDLRSLKMENHALVNMIQQLSRQRQSNHNTYMSTSASDQLGYVVGNYGGFGRPDDYQK